MTPEWPEDPSERPDPALEPLIEAGEGESEGFELAEEDLIEAAQHGDSTADPLGDAFTPEIDGFDDVDSYGEADHEGGGDD